MERIQGLKEYVQTEHYLEGIGIGKEEQKEIQITYQPLAQGEYNINYWFVHPLTGKKLVLRVNTGSQMHLENQIELSEESDGSGRMSCGYPQCSGKRNGWTDIAIESTAGDSG